MVRLIAGHVLLCTPDMPLLDTSSEGTLADSMTGLAHNSGMSTTGDETLSFRMPTAPGARGVVVTDVDHRVLYTDSGVSGLLGVDAADLTGKDILDAANTSLKHLFTDPDAFVARVEWLCDHPLDTAEDVMELAGPEPRIMHRYSTPLLDENGQPVGRVEVYSDITKRRHLEEANIALYKQISSAYEELKATQDQLLQSEKLRAIGEIASGVAHDFNNTLGIILGNIQLLLRTIDDPKQRARLESVERAVLDGTETVRRIREFTRLQPDEPLTPVDLSVLTTTVVDMMKPSLQSMTQARDCRIDLELELGAGILAAGVAPEIREVLANVLLNAVQAMPGGGTIHISTDRSESSVWVKVMDTGVGMTDEVLNRIFDPFFTTRGVEGTGLGMSVAYGIVKRHNGKITVESVPNEGTSVTIHLPYASEESELKAAESASESSPAPVRILVIEDEEMFAQVFVDMLSECGHAVCVARSGPEAIEQFRATPFDLVFTDLGMPEMSGWQVARSIKEIQPATPVVMLTGWGAEVDEERIARSQVDMVLSKPVKMEDLSGIVSRALSGVRK